MTQNQLDWMQDNGLDPVEYDMTPDGRVLRKQAAVAQAPQREVMSVPRAFGTSFLGNVLPAGAGLGAGSLLAPLALSNPWTGIPAVIGGSMLAAYGAGKGQQAALERFAPSAVEEMQRAETDQPVASWAGGSAPALLTFKPSFKGISGLSAPLMRGRDTFTKFDPATTARFVPAAVNVGVNAASAGAGQLVNMSEGGDFSLPRFAADTAFGSIVSNPNALGRRMGFPSMTPQRGPVTRLELTPEPTLGSPIEESQKLYGSMPEGSVGRPPSLSQVSNADKSAYEAYSGYKEPEPSKSAETLARELYSAELSGQPGKPPSLGTVANADKTAYEAYSGQQPAPAPEVVKSATDAAREIYTRLQGSAEEGPSRITQEDLDAASEIAAVRGLKLQFADLGGGRGKFQLNTPDGIPLIEIDPNSATRDTAIHEIGHDVYARSVGEGMKKGLMATAEDSPVYKAEYEARINARDKEGNLTHTEQQAREIALEEGVIQKFGEEYPNVKPGEIRQWFNALKASVKDLAGMKLSPEDANAYLRYLTNENVPWKGVAVAKTGQERLQRGEKPPELEALNAQLRQAQEAERTYKQQNPYDREGIKALEADSKKAMNAYFEKSQAYEEANPKYPGIENAPEFLPSEDKYYRSFQDPEDDQTGLRHMAKGKIWPDAFVMEIDSPRGVIDANNNSLRGRFKPEQVTKIIHDVDSFEPYPHDYIAELRRKYPNAEIVDGVLNDRQDGYRILGPAKSEPSMDSSDIRYQRAQQETPAFKNWFGESKVVDAEGKPLTVYHGTDADFTSFKQAKEGYFGKGIYLTPNPDTASGYAASSAGGDTRGKGGNVMPLYASIKNPMSVVDDGFTILGPIEVLKKLGYSEDKALALFEKAMESKGNLTGELQTKLKLQGYDGIITNNPDGTIREIIAFNPEQVKSASANRGTFDPLNKDIRYQRPIDEQAADAVKAGVDKTLAEIDQITRRGGIYETVGRSLTRAYNTETSMLGKARSLALKIINLDYSDANKLRSHLYNEYRNQQLITPAPEIAEAYKEWRTQAKAFWVAEANKVGHQIDAGKKGLRNRIESEFWFPGHDLSDEVRDILASKVGTPEYQKLKNDYLRDAEADYLSQGKLMTVAKEKALVDFEEQRALNNKTFDPSAPANFAGARKPMGRPLPESWVEKDFRKTLESYNKRSAKDYAAQEHFEKSPEVMAALGSKKFFNDQPIPASVLQNTPVIAPDPSIQSVMREFSGQPLQMPGKMIRSFGAMASSLALQTISRIGDVGGTVTKPLAYIGLGDYGAYMGGMAEKLSDWSKLKARSIESGLNNPNANQNFHQVIGMGQDAGKYMQKVLDSIGFITGSSKLESVARTLAQAQGEMIVSINKRKAATGDKDAVRFLDTLNNDWRTQSDMALAAQFGQMMQGTYDMRQLPAWFLEGGAAPYLTWSKWSMSQMNNFRKFAVEPAMQGNFKPLIAQVLVGMAGGGAIEQVQEWLSGKESKSVKWSELESWARQNEGTIGTDGGELLLQKFMIMAQKTGTFGFAGDLAMMPINALVGDTQSSVGVFPAAELFADGMKNVAGALTAIDKGEDVGLVLQRFGKNVIVGKTQMARVASTWIDEVFNEGSDNLRSADRRKARLFEELSGTGRSNGMFPVSYENLAEQQFERSSVSEDTGEEAFSLVKTARESATSREDYASRIRKLKTSQNQIMPSLDRQPQKAARYLGFVEGAEPGKGSETLKRYYTRQNEDKYRKSLIESFSGIR